MSKELYYAQHINKMDSVGKIWFERELSRELQRTFEIKYAGLRAREFLPINREAQSGDKEIIYKMFDAAGQAKPLSDACSPSMSKVGVGAEEFTRKIQPYGDCFCYNMLDLRRSSRTGAQLPAKLSAAARKMLENSLEDLACFGDTKLAIPYGFLNEPNVPVVGVSAGSWDTATPDDIIADVRAMWKAMVAGTLGVHAEPTDLLLPNGAYACVKSTRLTDTGTTVAAFIENEMGLTISRWSKLETAGAGGITRAVLYRRDPEMLELHISNDVEFMPAQEMGFEIEVQAILETGGTTIYYPLSMHYLDGV